MIADMDSTGLKQCPFCGSDATLRMTGWTKEDLGGRPNPGNRYWAKCSKRDCGITTQCMGSIEAATAAWNTRSA